MDKYGVINLAIDKGFHTGAKFQNSDSTIGIINFNDWNFIMGILYNGPCTIYNSKTESWAGILNPYDTKYNHSVSNSTINNITNNENIIGSMVTYNPIDTPIMSTIKRTTQMRTETDQTVVILRSKH